MKRKYIINQTNVHYSYLVDGDTVLPNITVSIYTYKNMIVI